MRYAKNKAYHRLLSSHRWQTLRASYLAKHPVCESCDKEGNTTLACVVHHVVPVEDATDVAAMESLAFDASNLMALCNACHERIHTEIGSHAKKGKRTTRAEAHQTARAFIERWCGLGPEAGQGPVKR